MASVGAKDPLDVLQQMFNETLVHTGKAIRASQKNGAQNIASSGGSSHGKMIETMENYHLALNDVESEIVCAKAVLLRDLEKLRAARVPVPSPQPQPPPPVAAAPAPAPAPAPTPAPAPAAPVSSTAPPPPAAAASDPTAAPVVAQTKQPPAVMMEMPSTAAHSVSANPKPEVKDEAKRVAPFPDMGMGMGADVVDLTAGDSKSATVPVRPAPAAVAAAAAAAPARPGPPVARATAPVNPSPKPAPPPRAAASVTPQPPPPATIGSVTQTAANPSQPSGPPPTAQDNSMDAMLSLPTAEAAGGAAMADMTGGELNFTNMEFSLAPATETPSQNAPPAPMADFDLSSFSAPQDSGNDLLSLDNFGAGTGTTNGQASAATDGTENGTVANNIASTQHSAGPNPSASDNVNSIFDMGGGDSMDLDLNLDDAGGMGESNFDDLFIPNDMDMGDLDETYFNLD